MTVNVGLAPRETTPDRLVVDRPVVLDETGRVLMRAAEIIRERGHVKGTYGTRGYARCMLGAIYEAGWKLKTPARLRVEESLGGKIAPFNDTPRRTDDEVAEALERAAYRIP